MSTARETADSFGAGEAGMGRRKFAPTSTRLFLLAAVVLLASGCANVREKMATVGIFVAPPPGGDSLGTAFTGCSAEQRLDYEMDAEREYFFGRAIGARMLGDLGVAPLAPEHPVARYVEHIGQLLAIAGEVQGEATVADRDAHAFSKDVPDRPWPLAGYHFLVLPLDEPNAFGSPGGLVTVTTGLLRQVKNEDELAGVLAHELVHVQRGHGVEVMKAHLCQSEAQGKVAKVAGESVRRQVGTVHTPFGGAAFSNRSTAELGELLEDAMKGVLSLFGNGYPKALELEADRMAVRLLVATGYSPIAFESLLLRMKSEANGRDKYMDTHPPFDDRIRTVRPALAQHPKTLQSPPAEDVAIRTARFTQVMTQLGASGVGATTSR